MLNTSPAVMSDFGTVSATPLDRLDLEALDTMHFAAGSMAPKIDACRRFVAATGGSAAIGSLSEVVSVLGGVAGTTITATTRRAPHVDVSAAPPVSQLTGDTHIKAC